MDTDKLAAMNLRRSAGAQGYKFVKLYLKDTYEHNTMSPIRVHGFIEIRGQKAGVKNGRDVYHVFVKRNGIQRFKFDENEGYFTSWMVIDREEARFGETGYNLDVLASHYNNPIFEIAPGQDDVQREVNKRVKVMKKFLAEEEAEKIKKNAELAAQKAGDEEESLDMEEKALEAKMQEIREKKETMADKKQKAIDLLKGKTKKEPALSNG